MLKIRKERKWDLEWKAEVAAKARKKAAANEGRRAGAGLGSRLAADKIRGIVPLLEAVQTQVCRASKGAVNLWLFVPHVFQQTKGGTNHARKL